MENVQNTTYHTKMPIHIEATKVIGALTLAAVAYFAKCHFLAIVCLTSIRLSTSRLAQTPINALPEVSLEKVKVLQIATLVSLLACSFKGYHRAVAGIYTLSALKITADYFFAEDQMIAQIFDRIGGEDKVSNLPEVRFDPALGVRENVQNNQDALSEGWSVSQLSDGRRVFLSKGKQQVDGKDIVETTAFVERFSVLDVSNYPNISSHSNSMLLSLGILTLAVAVLNKDTNDEHHPLDFSQAEGKKLTMTGRF
jgi:hypothetical protein